MKKPRNRLRLATRGRVATSPPLTYDWLAHDFAHAPGPLIEALRSSTPLPKHLRDVLIDLFERYRLVLKVKAKRVPSYRRLSDAEAKLEAAAEEMALRIRGPITREEMDNAVKVLEARAKREGRGRRSIVRMAAAQQLREEAKSRIAGAYGLTLKKFKNYLARKRGSSRR